MTYYSVQAPGHSTISNEHFFFARTFFFRTTQTTIIYSYESIDVRRRKATLLSLILSLLLSLSLHFLFLIYSTVGNRLHFITITITSTAAIRRKKRVYTLSHVFFITCVLFFLSVKYLTNISLCKQR